MVTSRKLSLHDSTVGKNIGGNDDRTDRIYRTNKQLQATDAPPLGEPLRGYIFVCNQETMDEDLRLRLFGLPLRYLESVKCIQPGMPLFLYNYTTHKLHGIYEATSGGGQNLDPDAWENKEFTRSANGGVVSRFPAQVRIKVRDERSPLDEGVFRKVLFHYEGSKFRLELGRVEVEELFQLFGVSGSRPRENVQVKRDDDDGGEWEKVTVKGKSKGFSRPQGGIAWKAPNPSAKKGFPVTDGRGRGFVAHTNGSSSYDHSVGDLGLARSGRGDNGGPWRNDGNVGTSSAVEEERSVKQRHENGEVRTASEVDRPESNGGRVKHHRHANGSGDGEVLSERSSDRSSDAAGSPKAAPPGSDLATGRAGPISYSAVLKAGLDGAAESAMPTGKARQVASADGNPTGTASVAVNVRGVVSSAQNGGKPDRVDGEMNGVSSEGRADTMSTTGSLQSRGSSVAGDDKPVEVPQLRAQENGGSDAGAKGFEKPLGAWGRRYLPVVSSARPGDSSKIGNGSWSSVAVSASSGLSEVKGKDGAGGRRLVSPLISEGETDGHVKVDGAREVSTKGTEGLKDSGPSMGDVKSPKAASAPKAGVAVKQVGGGSASAKNAGEATAISTLAKNGAELKSSEMKFVGVNAGITAKSSAVEVGGGEVKPSVAPPVKKAWQGNEAAVLRRLADPDPAPAIVSTAGPVSKLQQDTVQAGRYTEVQGSSAVRTDDPSRPSSSAGNRQSRGASSLAVDTLSPTSKSDTSAPERLETSTRSPQGIAASPVSSQQQRSPSSQPPTQYHRRQQQISQEFHQRPSQSGDRPKHSPSERQQQVQQHRRQQGMQMQQARQEQLPLPLLPPPLQQGQVMVAPLRVATPPQVQSPSYSGAHHQLFSPVGPLPSPQQRQGMRGRGGGNRSMGHEGPGMVYVRTDGPMAMQSGHLSPAWGLQSPVMMPTMMAPIGGNPNFTVPPASLLANLNLPALHEEILEFALHARPSAAARARAEGAVECVRNAVQQLWPGSDVEIFGSFATGLCLPHSDVDCVVVGAPNPSPSGQDAMAASGGRALAPLIRELASALKKQSWCESLSSIETASMPVVKLRCRPPPGDHHDVNDMEETEAVQQSVAIDITIGGRKQSHESGGSASVDQKDEGAALGDWKARVEAAKSTHNGAAAREFVIERLRRMPALAPLVLLMKSYLHHRGLKDVYSGGLGSFSLTLMLVFYLERVPLDTGMPSSSVHGEAVSKSEEAQSSAKSESQPFPGVEDGTTSAPSLPKTPSVPPPAELSTTVLSPSVSSKELASPADTPVLAAEVSPCTAENHQENVEAAATSCAEIAPPTISERSACNGDEEDSGVASERGGGLAQVQADSSSSCTGGSDAGVPTRETSGVESMATASSEGVDEDGTESLGVETSGSSRKGKQGKKGGIAEEIVESMLSVPSPNLGILLAGFLHIFGEALDTSLVKLVLKGSRGDGGVFLQDPKRAPRVVLWIDDPLRPGSNIGAGSFAMFYVQQAMREMLASLRGTGSQAEIGSEVKIRSHRRNTPILDSLFLQPQISRAMGQFSPTTQDELWWERCGSKTARYLASILSDGLLYA